MKTKNNVQKTILRSAAVVFSFVLISITVSAQDFWKRLLENSSFNEIALAMVETSDEIGTTESTTESFNFILFENESEQTLEIEEWMHNDNYFGVTSTQNTVESDMETEMEVEVEAWMLDENIFSVEENFENELVLEAWMTSENVWEI